MAKEKMNKNQKDKYILLGLNIAYYRKLNGFTQEKLAEKCGISLDYLGKIEVAISKPGLKTIIKLSQALDIDIKELFEF